MNILLINGAPRKNGYTDMLLDLFKRGVIDAGVNPAEIVLRNYNIATCKGCFACWLNSEKGVCIQQDDMDKLLPMYLACDVIVLASPVYYYSLSALLKRFLERIFPSSTAGLDHGTLMHLDRLSTRHEEQGPKKAVLITAGAMRSLKNMDGMVRTYELIVNGIGATSAGVLLRPESFYMDFAIGKPITNRKVQTAFENAGRELVQNGMISKETQKAASLPFTKDDRHFKKHFTTYWTIAAELGGIKATRENISEAASRDLRILIHELALCFDPKAGGDLKAIIQFVISDPTDAWYLKIEDGQCTAFRSHYDSTITLTLTLTQQILVGILLGKQDPREALSLGAMTVSGSKNLLMRFGRIFPPPSG